MQILMRIPLQMLPDFGVTILLIVIAVCLILLTLSLRKIWDTLINIPPPTTTPTPRSGNPIAPPVHPPSYYDDLIRREREFFEQYANRGNGEYRTVSFTNAIIQSYMVLSNAQSKKPYLSSAIKEEYRKTAQKSAAKSTEIIEIPSVATDNCLVNYTEEELADLGNIVLQYESYLSSVIGADQVGKICLCPDGVSYCNWSSEMFEAFIIDNILWNLISIQIFDNFNNLLSTSSISQIQDSPSGRYSLVTMSNQATLANLPVAATIRIVFNWLEGDLPKCVVMMNVIPSKDGEETAPKN